MATKVQYDNTQALNAYCQAMARLQAQVDLLEAYVDDFGNVTPADIDWGHVGTINHIVAQIEAVRESM